MSWDMSGWGLQYMTDELLAPRKWCKNPVPHDGHHHEWRNSLIYYCKGRWRNKHHTLSTPVDGPVDRGGPSRQKATAPVSKTDEADEALGSSTLSPSA